MFPDLRLWVAVFVSGGVLMALEVLAFLINARTFGGAWRETTAVIAVFLVAMSTGYATGGALADRRPRAGTLAAPLAAAAALVALVPLVEPAISNWIFASALPIRIHSLVACTLIYLLPVGLLSMTSPIAARLRQAAAAHAGRTTGGILAVSTAGSLAGTLATGYFLIDAFTVTASLYLLAGTALLAAGIVVLPRRGAAAALVLLVGLPAGGEAQARQVIHERQTPYHHIVVADEGGLRRLELNNRLHSTSAIGDPLIGNLEYTDYVYCALLFNERIRRVLVIGLGGGSIPKRLLHDFPDVVVDVAELDPGVAEVARAWFGVPDSPRLHVVAEDGRVFIRRARERYDVVVVDAYSSNRYGLTVPRHLVTQEFLRELRGVLTPQGAMIYNVIGNSQRRVGRMNRALQKTVATVFDAQYSWDVPKSNNTMLVALTQPSRWSLAELVHRATMLMQSGRVRMREFPARVERLHVAPYDGADVPVLTDDYAPVDQLMNEE